MLVGAYSENTSIAQTIMGLEYLEISGWSCGNTKIHCQYMMNIKDSIHDGSVGITVIA